MLLSAIPDSGILLVPYDWCNFPTTLSLPFNPVSPDRIYCIPIRSSRRCPARQPREVPPNDRYCSCGLSPEKYKRVSADYRTTRILCSSKTPPKTRDFLGSPLPQMTPIITPRYQKLTRKIRVSGAFRNRTHHAYNKRAARDNIDRSRC